MTYQSEVAPLRRVALKHAREAFESQQVIDDQWRELGYLERPEYDRACREYDAFAALLEEVGAHLEWVDDRGVGMDSIYVRDAAVISDRGAIACRMGKAARQSEPEPLIVRLADTGIAKLGAIEDGGALEGGDVTWLSPDVLAVGRGYRTNQSGVDQLSKLLPHVTVCPVPLPHWKGEDDVFHLMSILSPLDERLLLVYSPLMPVPFRERLLAEGFRFVEVPPEEFESQGCNVLATGPSVAVALDGNPETKRRMEAAGVEVHTFVGQEISLKGCGGPTCLTRPLERG